MNRLPVGKHVLIPLPKVGRLRLDGENLTLVQPSLTISASLRSCPHFHLNQPVCRIKVPVGEWSFKVRF